MLLDNHTVDDVTLQSAAVFYINPEKLVKHHHALRMTLQCLNSEDRVGLLLTEVDRRALIHLIAPFDKTGETMRTVLK